MSSSILFPTNEYATSTKSSEEIQILMAPEMLSHADLILHLINKNHTLQLPFVYKNFGQSYEVCLETICEKAIAQTPENQILICQSFKFILQNKQKHKSITVQHLNAIFEMTLECLNNLNSTANQHLATILEILLKIHPNRSQLIEKLEAKILSLGQPNQPTISKVTSGRLIAIVSKHIGKMIKGQMIDILKRILTDNQIEARKVWVIEIFPKLLEGLELEFVELHLQEKIYECVYDQNEDIGMLSLKVILKNVTRFSIEEQSSRIVKLFIDSLTSKNQKISTMVTEIMGEVFEKLINIIMKNEIMCTKFWRSLVELAQSKNEKVLNNLSYNLPGILLLSSSFHKTDAFVDIYCELFYEPLTDKELLVSYFHEIASLYPKKKETLKEVIYWMFAELFDEEEDSSEYDISSIKILNLFVKNLPKSKGVFMIEETIPLSQPTLNNLSGLSCVTAINDFQTNTNNGTASRSSISQKSLNSSNNLYPSSANSSSNNQQQNSQQGSLTPANITTKSTFEPQICEYLIKYMHLLQSHKHSQWIILFLNSIKEVVEYLPLEFIQKTLLPKIYTFIRNKVGSLEQMVEIMVLLLRRDIHNLMNFYASKVHVEFSKSSKSHERKAALYFFYYCSVHFSIDLYQQYKFGEKFLSFNSDKSFENKYIFVKYLERIQYFFNRQEKIQMAIIISRLMKDADSDIIETMMDIDYNEKETIKCRIVEESKLLRENEKLQVNSLTQAHQPVKTLKPIVNNRRESRESKELKKEDLLKKRIETNKSKTKMLIKEMPKAKKLTYGFSSKGANSSSTSKRNS